MAICIQTCKEMWLAMVSQYRTRAGESNKGPARLATRKKADEGFWLLLSRFQPACMNADIITRIIANIDMIC